jgi:hypothetical protein
VPRAALFRPVLAALVATTRGARERRAVEVPAQAQRLLEDALHGVARIERSERILDDGLNAPAQRAPRRLSERAPRLSSEANLTTVRALQCQRYFAQRGLSGAGFTQDAQRLAGSNDE